jgi:hypothetical protein
VIDQTDFSPAFKAKLAEVEAQFTEKEAKVEDARRAVKAAEDASFAAARRYEHFQLTVLRACRGSIAIGSDERMLTLVTGTLDDLAYEELQLKEAADIALTRAQKLLANLEYQLGNLRDAAAQLRQCINPPPIGASRLEVVKRPERLAVDIDDVVLPPAARSAA